MTFSTKSDICSESAAAEHLFLRERKVSNHAAALTGLSDRQRTSLILVQNPVTAAEPLRQTRHDAEKQLSS